MADQPINSDDAIIENVVNASWQKGACPPEWAGGSVESNNLVASTPLSADTEMGDFN